MEEIISKSIRFEDGIVNIKHALQVKWAGSHWVSNGETYNDISWLDTSPITKPLEEEVNTEVIRLQAEYDTQTYARNRATEYPAIADQLDEIYHNGIDSWKAVIKVTKDKYPKG